MSAAVHDDTVVKLFDLLLYRYTDTVKHTYGCGPCGQGSIDKEWHYLLEFVHEYPAFKSQIPEEKFIGCSVCPFGMNADNGGLIRHLMDFNCPFS